MKFLLLIVVIVIALLMLTGRRRRPGREGREPPRPKPEAQAMVRCAHCGVHLPRGDALLDSAGRSFCGEAHRIAGPK
ncbi:MAG: PP0621 family protein [Rubrivivax sp.]